MPDAPVRMVADHTRLAQVVANLLNNAARYTPPGGEIRLIARVTATEVVIEVRDNGVGIAPEMRARIFEIFTQVGAQKDRPSGGLGIGLALVRQLVELHQGSIEVSSEGLGRGSRFIVTLPLDAEADDAEDLPAR